MSEEVKEVVTEKSEETKSPEVSETGTEIQTAKGPDEVSAVEAGKEVSAYTPNYKFKVLDEEKEYDEWIRPVIKDSETEKKVKEIYEKAYGLDTIKPKHEELKTKYSELDGKHSELSKVVSHVLELRDKDLGSCFKQIGITDEMVAQYMLEKIQRMDMTPEQRAVYDQRDQARQAEINYARQLNDLKSQVELQSVQARTLELNTVLNQPDVSDYAKAYDAAQKQSGAFKQRVIDIASLEWHRNQVDLPVEEAVKRAMEWAGDAYRQKAETVIQPQQVLEDKPLPVIPRVSGKAVSPTGKKVTSTNDLRKIYRDMTA